MPLDPWTLLGAELLLQTRIFKLYAERWRSPRTRQDHTFSMIDAPDWVNVVAFDVDGRMIMVRQYRFGTRTFTLEVAGGMVDPGEDPRAAAARELREETGYRAGSIADLGFIYPNPAIQNNKAHMFLVERCEHEGRPQLDAGEDIEVALYSPEEVVDLLHRGEISHALVAVALQRWLLLREGKLRLVAR